MALDDSGLAATLPNLRIRLEEPRDIPQLHALVHAAFGRADEARLLDRLRDEGALLLSHVALLDDELVGQAAYSLVSVDDGARVNRFPALGPIAVSPARQRQGIGSALVWAGLLLPCARRDMACSFWSDIAAIIRALDLCRRCHWASAAIMCSQAARTSTSWSLNCEKGR